MEYIFKKPQIKLLNFDFRKQFPTLFLKQFKNFCCKKKKSPNCFFVHCVETYGTEGTTFPQSLCCRR